MKISEIFEYNILTVEFFPQNIKNNLSNFMIDF